MGVKGEKTKELIRQEAYKLFAEKGFKEVTMKDICERTGLSRGGLYRHYSGAAEIFAEILSEEYVIADRIEKQESATEILKDMLAEIKREIPDKENSLSLAIYEYANQGNAAFFEEIQEKAKKRWNSLIEYGMESGEFRSVNADQITDMILYYYQGLRMWSRVIPFEEKTAEHFVQTVRGMLLKGDLD